MKEVAPAVLTHPEARPKESEVSVDTKSVLENAERDEARRVILREAIDRFNNELMDDEERMLLLDRIKRLRIRLALT